MVRLSAWCWGTCHGWQPLGPKWGPEQQGREVTCGSAVNSWAARGHSVDWSLEALVTRCPLPRPPRKVGGS